MEKAVVYMVAGMSSRFGGRVKQLIKVGPNNESLIELSVAQALKAGFDGIIFIVGEKTESSFKELFGTEYQGVEVRYAVQTFDPEVRDRPWGTTDALLAAKDVIDCPFVVCNGDDLYGEEAFEQIATALDNHESATLGYRLIDTMPDEGKVNRGIFQEQSGSVVDLVETFDMTKQNLDERGISPDSLCSMNFFGLQPSVLTLLAAILADFKVEHEGDRRIECLLPTDLNTLIKANKLTIKLYPTDSQWMGVTNPEDEEILRQRLQK